MRNTKKAFTLVELIVVITILAILATVAFVSLWGQTDNARNTVKKDSLGKLATAVENARTNGLNLAAFASGVTANQFTSTEANVAGTWVLVGTDYNAGDINLTALDVKAADFKDGTHNFKYGYTTKTYGKYELAATIKEWDLQKAYVVGTFSPRTTAATTVEWTAGTLTAGSKYTFKLTNATDIKKLGYGDYIKDSASTPVVGKVLAVSPDYMTLTIEMSSSPVSPIRLNKDDTKGLIKAVNWQPVQLNTENVPYTL